MRRSVLERLASVGVVACVSAALVGCEDGPTQTYQPAPPNAGNNWNNADAAVNDPGAQDYDAGGGGTNAVNICTAAEQNDAWSKAFVAPIVPPFSMGGLDLSTGGTFDVFTIEMAEKGVDGAFKSPKLCQGAPSSAFDASNLGYAWGPNGQLYTAYDIATHALTFFQAYPGYDGEVTFKLPKTYNGQDVPHAVDQTGQHVDVSYVWHIGQPIKENGQVLKNLWSPNGMDPKVANRMYLALMYTFQPTLIAPTDATHNELTDPNYDCLVTTKCRTSANPDASGGNFGVRPVGVYFDAAQSNSSDPATAGSPSDIYMYPVKFEPFSLSPYSEGLDTFVSPSADPSLQFNGQPIYGPYAPAGVLSPPGKPALPFCTLYMGQNWGDFVKNCVTTTGDPSLDKVSMAKLLGAQHHDDEWFSFSVVGVNQNFSGDDKELSQNGQPSVLADTAGHPPNNDDVATDFIVDVRANGPVLNDTRGDRYPALPGVSATEKYEDRNLNGQDLHGTAAVMGYYRQLVFDDLRKQMAAFGTTPAVDPKTCWMPHGQNPKTWVAPSGCTGFEQMATPAMPVGNGTWQDSLDVTPAGFSPSTIFRPGDPTVKFIADPPGFAVDPTQDPPYNIAGGHANAFVTASNLLQASLQQVTFTLGHGNVNALPPAARDWRYFFQFWAQSFTKYLLNRSKNPTWQALYADDSAAVHTLRQINKDDLFFDLFNGLDKFEYVDRTAAAQLGAPVDFEYDMLLSTSNTQDNNFYQRLARCEKALYQTMLTDKSQVPGSNENVFLSDLFGAPAILNALPNSAALDASNNPIPGKDEWYCATHVDSDCTASGGPANVPPHDRQGNMLLDAQGRPLFWNYHGIFAGTPFTIGNKLNITQTMPLISQALVELPNFANPYDSTSKSTPLTTIVPWVPSIPGNGFEIPINAQRSQFIQTGSLDFSGVTITTNVDYTPNYDKNGNLVSGTIAAVETQDFLGEVFPCVDPTTGDILRVRMYSSMLDILNWFDTHPGSREACNIFVRTSPYNNYPDYLVSLTNGVLLAVNPGAGGGPGRIADATLFNPALLTQTQ